VRERREVAGAVAQHRRARARDRAEHELAHLAVGDRRAGHRVEALDDEVVFGDVHAVAALALAGDPGVQHLGEAVVVGGGDGQAGFDLRAHLLAAGLGAEQAQAELQVLGRDALVLNDLAEIEHIRRRGDEHGGAEVLHELELAGRVAGADGQHGGAGALQAVVQPEPAREHAVAKGHLGDVVLPHPGGHRDAADQLRPGVEIGLREAAGETLNASLVKWIARYVTARSAVTPAQSRSRSYFEATLGLLNQHGVTPCIVIMPYHPRALEALTNAGWRPRLTALKAYLQGLRATYPFHLFNYNTVAAFEGHTRYFYDGAHPTVENSRILLRHAVKAAPESIR